MQFLVRSTVLAAMTFTFMLQALAIAGDNRSIERSFESRLQDSEWMTEYFSHQHGQYNEVIVDLDFDDNLRAAADVFLKHFDQAQRLLEATSAEDLGKINSNEFSYLQNHFRMMNLALGFVARSGLETNGKDLVLKQMTVKAHERAFTRSWLTLLGSATAVGLHAGIFGVISAVYGAPFYLVGGIVYAVAKAKKPRSEYAPSGKKLNEVYNRVLEERFEAAWKTFFARLEQLDSRFESFASIGAHHTAEARIGEFSRFLGANLKTEALIKAGLLSRSQCETLLLPPTRRLLLTAGGK